MSRSTNVAATAALALASCLAGAGCGGSGSTQSATAAESENGPLSQVGALYRDFQQSKNKPPQSVKDFLPLAEGMPEGVTAVRDGSIVVIWDSKLADLTPEAAGDPADEVLAYEKQAPEQGGYVLMKNRRIRKMSADEFKTAKKAPGKLAEASKKAG